MDAAIAIAKILGNLNDEAIVILESLVKSNIFIGPLAPYKGYVTEFLHVLELFQMLKTGAASLPVAPTVTASA